MAALYDILQAEFCPQLDTSLLAAIIADHAPSEDNISLTPNQVENIRQLLKVLATQAQEHQRELDEIEAIDASLDIFSSMSSTSPTTPGLCNSTISTSSGSETSSQHSFSSPLGFLQEAFSDVPTERLKQLLREENGEAPEGEGDLDMERMVEYILTMEHIRELEERGLDTREISPLPSLSSDWSTVAHTKTNPTPKLATPTKKKAKGRTIKLVDMMQTQHLPPSQAHIKRMQKEGLFIGAGVDIWTHVSSLSVYLAALLPPVPASHFSSFFHSPTHSTPACALRAALAALSSTPPSAEHQHKSNSPINEFNGDADTTLFALLDILQDSPTFVTLDAEQRNTLCADARLAISVTQNRPDDALDIVWILSDLEHPGSNAGIYHLPPPSGSNLVNTRAAHAKLSTGPPSVQPPPTSKRKSLSSLTVPPQSPAPENTWHTVPIRSSRTTHPHPSEDHNVTYKRKVRGAGNGLGKGGKGDVGELHGQGNALGAQHPHFTRGMFQAREERGELLREAGRAWQRPWGGEVALYYAQKAREVMEKARGEALDEARGLVEARRYATHDKRTIDLHGTCVREAIIIASEILKSEGCSPASPICLITGRGAHSAGGVGVLKPAVHRVLVAEGWDVRMWDGGLVVRGRDRWGVS